MAVRLLLSSFARVLLTITILLTAGTEIARADATSPMRLLVTTCFETINNLAQVDRIAQEKKWKKNVAPAQRKNQSTVRSRSIWEATHDGQEYLVATAIGKWRDGKPANVCMIVFGKTVVNGSDFQKKLLESLKLKALAETKLSNANMSVHELENGRTNRVLLHMTTRTDGNLIQASVMTRQ